MRCSRKYPYPRKDGYRKFQGEGESYTFFSHRVQSQTENTRGCVKVKKNNFPGEVWIFLGTTHFAIIVVDPFALEQGVIPQGLCDILLWQLAALSAAWMLCPEQIHLGHLDVI